MSNSVTRSGASTDGPPRLFGHFLVDHGVLERDELDEALRLISAVNATVGQLAVEHGLVSAAEAEHIHQLQRRIDGRWGDIALRLGIGRVTAENLQQLCDEQDAQNLRLSDAIIDLGFASATTIDAMLRQFETEREQVVEPQLPAGYAGFKPITHVLDVLPRMGSRILRQVVQRSGARDWQGAPTGLVCATASLLGPIAPAGSRIDLTVGMAVDDVAAVVIARALGADEAAANDEATQHAMVGEFVALLVGFVQTRLESEPRRETAGVRISEPLIGELPTSGIAFELALGDAHGLLVLERGT